MCARLTCMQRTSDGCVIQGGKTYICWCIVSVDMCLSSVAPVECAYIMCECSVCMQCMCSKLVAVSLRMHECAHVESVQSPYSMHVAGVWLMYSLFRVCMQGVCRVSAACIQRCV